MTAPLTFRKPDVTRAISAAVKAGLKVSAVRFPPEGGFVIVTAEAEPSEIDNPWDKFFDET